MIIETIEKPYEQMKQEIRANLASYSEPIDSYYEDHVIESKHYEILLDNVKCGYYSVFENELLTQFALDDKHMARAQEVFHQVLEKSSIKEIYLSTSDRLLLLLALDEQKSLTVQDYVFQVGERRECKAEFMLRKAVEEDIPGIRENDGGFFQNLESNIKNGELFIGLDGDRVVSYGIIENSKIFEDLASMGMFVIAAERGKGYGANTLSKLIIECQSKGFRPIAGCFVKNRYSVQALKKAGMVSKNRLLRVKVA
jgi:hypothetical protein